MSDDEYKGTEIYATAILEESEELKIRVYEESEIERLQSTGYFGNLVDDILELDPEETLLLMERGRLQLKLKNEDANELEILTIEGIIPIFSEKDPYFYRNYLVFKDLRNRGYIIKRGFGKTSPYRLYPRGATPKMKESKKIVYPFSETQRLKIEELDSLVTQARRLRKQLILGVVDRLGDVTYYNTEQLELKENQFSLEEL